MKNETHPPTPNTARPSRPSSRPLSSIRSDPSVDPSRTRRQSQVEVLLSRLTAHLFEFLQDLREVLLHVLLQRRRVALVHAQDLVRLLHVRVELDPGREHLREREAVRRRRRPLKEPRQRARRLQHQNRHFVHIRVGAAHALAHRDHLVHGVRLGSRERERLVRRLLAPARRERHLRDVLSVQIRGFRVVVRAPHRLLLEHGHGVAGDERLHEAAQTQHGVIHPARLEVLLHRELHVHQRHLLVLLALVDGVEDVALDAHGRRGLDGGHLGVGSWRSAFTTRTRSYGDQSDLGFPVDAVRVLLGPRGGRVDDDVHADERRGERLGLGEVAADGRRAPVAEKIRGVHARADEASDVVALVERSPHHLTAERAGRADDEHRRLAHGRAGGRGRGLVRDASQRRARHARRLRRGERLRDRDGASRGEKLHVARSGGRSHDVMTIGGSEDARAFVRVRRGVSGAAAGVSRARVRDRRRRRSWTCASAE
eukprot:31410-Pelagococcus_subviridis.AAC.3